MLRVFLDGIHILWISKKSVVVIDIDSVGGMMYNKNRAVKFIAHSERGRKG